MYLSKVFSCIPWRIKYKATDLQAIRHIWIVLLHFILNHNWLINMKLLAQWVDHRYIIFLCRLNRWMNNLHYPYENLEVGTFLFDLGKINETRELIPEFYHCLAATQFSSVQLLSHVWLFAVPWITACQASLSITNSQSPPKPMSIESWMPPNHLILC